MLWWLWFPPLLLIIQVTAYLIDRPFYNRWIDGELGLIEMGTVAVVLPGVVAGILIWRARRLLPTAWLSYWYLLVTLGCVYFAGEELSWGQHLLGWQTPESLQTLNDQQETNLHNISSWLDQKPRLFLELWVVIGGLIVPLWGRIKDSAPNSIKDWRYWFWPSQVCLLTAALVVLVKLPEKLNDWFDVPRPPPLDMRVSETQEYYFGLFLSLYLASVYVRLRHRKTKT